MTSYTTSSLTWTAPWDHGVTWFSRRSVLPVGLPLDVEYVAEKVLRVMNGTEEYTYIESLIRAFTHSAEEATQRALLPQTWELVLSGFPSDAIVLPRPPFISMTSFAYTDASGDEQTLAGSPAEYRVIPSGERSKARVVPLSGASWPSTRTQGDAVTLTYRAGYADTNDPEYQRILMGICVAVGEAYKNRSLSVQDIQNVPTVLALEHFWRRVW